MMTLKMIWLKEFQLLKKTEYNLNRQYSQLVRHLVAVGNTTVMGRDLKPRVQNN